MSNNKPSIQRSEVYAAIDGERDYQDRVWTAATTTSGGAHSVAAWLTFMRHYLRLADEAASTLPEPECSETVLNIVRKITAMGVACMEQNGAPPREGAGS